MRRRVSIYTAVMAGAAALVYAAAQTGQTPAAPAEGHEGHQATPGQTAESQHEVEAKMGHPMMSGMAAKSDGMRSTGTMGMMGQAQMMGSLAALDRPLVRSLFGAFLVPELQAELALTADQASQLKQQKTELLTTGEDFSRKIAAKEKALDALFAPDTSKGQQVKALLEQIAELRAEQHYAIYASARKMKTVLTDEQRNRLEALKPEEMRHAAMSHLTLDDFAKAVQMLRFAL
jgi:hypothetical protein